MNLFINAVSHNWKLIIFDDKKDILFEKELQVAWNESEKLIWLVDEFLNDSNLNYNNLDNIVVVAGPWSFTWVRTIVLMANTINFVINKNMTSLSFFDLFNNYPIIKTSSKRDCFFKKSNDSKIEIITNEDLWEYLKENNITKIYWDFDVSKFENIEIIENINYFDIIKSIKLDNKKSIEALYIKKPNIC